MLEIGQTLRTARERQGLERADVERETHIRERYLEALEDERFEVVPGEAYARGFLRQYAEFLGLDGSRFVDELTTRLPSAEPAEVPPAVPVVRPRGRPSPLALAIVGVVVCAGIGVAAWRLTAGGSPTVEPRAAARPRHAVAAGHAARPARPESTRLVVQASGPCWLLVRAGSDTGPVLYQGTLAAGRSLRYDVAASRPRLWLRVGAPWNLRLTLGGRDVAAPAGAPGGPVDTVVTARGVAPG